MTLDELRWGEEITRLRNECTRLRALLTKAAEEKETALRAAHDWGFTNGVNWEHGTSSLEENDSFESFLCDLRIKAMR